MHFRPSRRSNPQRERDEALRIIAAVLSAFVFLMFCTTTARGSVDRHIDRPVATPDEKLPDAIAVTEARTTLRSLGE